jgi:cobalt-zinc-cadmium efflux system protein
VQGHRHSDDDHAHAHDHRRAGHRSARALGLALILTVAFAGVEAFVGLVGNSLTLMADAGHMVSDAAALVIALYAFRLGQRARTPRQTYGFRRAEILAALANAVAVATIGVLITRTAIVRWSTPEAVHGREVLIAAAIGLGVNLLAARILHGSAESNLNTRAAYLHVLGDVLGSVAALASGAFVTLFGWNRADPALSVGISLILLWGAWRLIRETTHVLMEGAPPGLDVAAIERAISSSPGVASVHDLHVWSITSGVPALTAHVVLAPGAHGVPVAMEVARLLRNEFGIEHATIQPESGPDGGKLVTIARRHAS